MKLASRYSGRGSALLLTLWCVAVLSLMAVVIAQLVELDVEGESGRSARLEARALALTGIAYGMCPTLKRGSELYTQRFPDGSQLDVRVASENARLNINLLLRQPENQGLKALFKTWEVPLESAQVAADSLQDWTDADDLRQLNGAERDQLQNQTQYALPQNRDFLSVDEMARVRGMDAIAELKPDWRESFSVFSQGKLDVQESAPELFEAFALFSKPQAQQWERLRNGPDEIPGTTDDLMLKSLDELVAHLGLSHGQASELGNAFGIGGEPTRIISESRVGNASYEITVVVNRSEGKPRILSWEER